MRDAADLKGAWDLHFHAALQKQKIAKYWQRSSNLVAQDLFGGEPGQVFLGCGLKRIEEMKARTGSRGAIRKLSVSAETFRRKRQFGAVNSALVVIHE